VARPKKNPLMEALIGELPEPGTDWPVEKQIAWLDLMSRAFGIVYGGDAAQQMSAKPEQVPAPTASSAKFVAPKKAKQTSYDFIVEEGGYVLNGKTKERLSPEDVKGKTVYDMRGIDGDIAKIIWADDSVGINGADFTLTPA